MEHHLFGSLPWRYYPEEKKEKNGKGEERVCSSLSPVEENTNGERGELDCSGGKCDDRQQLGTTLE